MESEPEGKKSEPVCNVAEVDCFRVEGSERSGLRDSVPVEEPISVIINGKRSMDVAMSPCDMEDFIIGHLVSEGSVKGTDEILKIEVGNGWIDVELDGEGRRQLSREVIFSACFGSTSDRPVPLDRITSGLELFPEQITGGVRMAMDSETHRKTGGIHTCAILRPGNDGNLHLASLREDVGRHNALDKAVGGALRADEDLSRCFLVSTGRASSEMVAKCYGARLPILCSRGATTTLAIQLARMVGITLVGFVRGSRMNVYFDSGRIR